MTGREVRAPHSRQQFELKDLVGHTGRQSARDRRPSSHTRISVIDIMPTRPRGLYRLSTPLAIEPPPERLPRGSTRVASQRIAANRRARWPVWVWADAVTTCGAMSDFGAATVLCEPFERDTTLAALGGRRGGA
jgi:hypothetical protein